METLLRCIYVDRKCPHTYTLSISTCKNKSTEAHDTLYIPTYEYNFKVIIGRDIILKEYYIIDRHKYENTKRYTI